MLLAERGSYRDVGCRPPCETRAVEHRAPLARWTGVCIDCADAEQLGSFYSQLLGWRVTERDGAGWLQLRSTPDGFALNIQYEALYRPPTWPEESGAQQKMIHFEIEVDDLQAAIGRVLDLGGRVAAHQPPDRDPSRLRILLDPAGHPLCLFSLGE